MNKEEINIYRLTTMGISLVYIFCFFNKLYINEEISAKVIISSYTIVAVFWNIYFWQGWKIPYLKCLIKKQNLNGSWFGTYESTDYENKKEYKGEIALQIKQDFFNIKIDSFTEKQISKSNTGIFNEKEESLDYFYTQETLDCNGEIRKGGAQLRYDGYDLKGLFWTNGNTKGVLNFRRVSKKNLNGFKKIKEMGK